VKVNPTQADFMLDEDVPPQDVQPQGEEEEFWDPDEALLK